MLGYPGVPGGILHDALLSLVWSAEYLLSRFGASGWQHGKSTHSLSVTWHGEDFRGLGVQGVEVLTLLGASPLPSMAPASQQGP
jgi:hypothetical protein